MKTKKCAACTRQAKEKNSKADVVVHPINNFCRNKAMKSGYNSSCKKQYRYGEVKKKIRYRAPVPETRFLEKSPDHLTNRISTVVENMKWCT